MTKNWMAALVLLPLAACAPSVPASPASPASPAPSTSPAPSSSPNAGASGRPGFESAPAWNSGTGTPAAVSDARLQAIRADLRARDVATDTLAVVESVAVTWNDGSWGCPTPGHSYTQALVPGQRVVVEAGGVRYDYRFGSGDEPKLCERR